MISKIVFFSVRCPQGWVYFKNCCYFHNLKELNFEEASNHCVKQGGFLATIRDQDENDFIYSK